MAVTQLSDLICASVYSQSFIDFGCKCGPRVWNSGVVASDPRIEALLETDSSVYNLRFYNELDQTIEPGLASDDPNIACDPQKVTQRAERLIKHYRTQNWSAAQVAAMCQSEEPLEAVYAGLNNYWMSRLEISLLASMAGIFNDNDANDGSDMTFDAIANGIDGSGFTRKNLMQALSTMGCCAGLPALLIVHCDIYWQIVGNEFAADERPGEAPGLVSTYAGMTIVGSDNPLLNPSPDVYHSYVVDNGAFVYQERQSDDAIILDRDECAGRGAGVSTLYTRKCYVLHPIGFSFTSNNIADAIGFPVDSELALADNWDRQRDRNCIRMARLISDAS